MLPIFVANDEDDDLEVAPSVPWAVGGMEPPEVRAGHFLVFDATGRQLPVGHQPAAVSPDGARPGEELPADAGEVVLDTEVDQASLTWTGTADALLEADDREDSDGSLRC